MKALILSNRVVQIAASEFDVSPSFQWVDISTVVPVPEVGWSYDGTAFSAPPPPPLPPTNDEIYDQVIRNQTVLKAVVLSINDGTLVPGAGVTGAALKVIVKANM